MKKQKKEVTPEVGDLVWVSVPVNARVIRINKKYGYTI
jgi:hypothetical protein